MTHVWMGFSGIFLGLNGENHGLNDGFASHVWWHSLPSIAGSTDYPCLQTLIQCRGSGPARATSGEQESPKWASTWLDFERKKRIPQKTWNFHQQNILEFYYSTIDVDPFRVFFSAVTWGLCWTIAGDLHLHTEKPFVARDARDWGAPPDRAAAGVLVGAKFFVIFENPGNSG